MFVSVLVLVASVVVVCIVSGCICVASGSSEGVGGVFFGFKCWNCVVSGYVLLGASQLVSVELGGAEVALWCVSGGICIARGGGLGC